VTKNAANRINKPNKLKVIGNLKNHNKQIEGHWTKMLRII